MLQIYKNALKSLCIPAVVSTGLITAYIALTMWVKDNSICVDAVELYPASFLEPILWGVLFVAPACLRYLFWERRKNGSTKGIVSEEVGVAIPYCMAALTVAMAILLSGSLTALFMTDTGWHFCWEFNTSFVVVFGCFISSAIYAVALMLLAITLGDSRIPACVYYGLFLVIPAFLVRVWKIAVIEDSNIFVSGFVGRWLYGRCNMASAFVISVIFGEDYFSLQSMSGVIYTVFCGLMIFAFALQRYKKQVVMQTAECQVSGRIRSSSGVLLYIGLSLAVAALFGGSIWMGKRIVKRDVPEAEHIRSLRITYMAGGVCGKEGMRDYYRIEMSRCEICNPEVIAILCDAVKKTEQQGLRNRRIDNVIFREKKDDDYKEDPKWTVVAVMLGNRILSETWKKEGGWFCLKMEGDMICHERKVYLTREEWKLVLTELEKEEGFRDIFLQPVPREDIASIVAIGGRSQTERNYAYYQEAMNEYREADFAEIVGLTMESCYLADLHVRLKDGRVQHIYLADGVN